MSFYCTATTIMPVELIKKAVDGMLASGGVDDYDLKTRAKALRTSIEALASESGIDLKSRKKNA